MDKKKLLGTIIGVIAFVLLMIGVTYAAYRWTSTSGTEDTNFNLTISRGLENFIVYKPGQEILSTSGTTLKPGSSYKDGINTTIEFWKNEKGKDKTIYGSLYLKILNMLSKNGTTNANISKTDAIKWAITTYNVNDTNEVLINQGTFKGKSKGNVWAINSNFKLNPYQTFYKVYLWLDTSAVDANFNISGELLSTEISAEAVDELPLSNVTLTNLGLNNLVRNGTPNFNTVATTDEGIYATGDNLGTSYYFRGASENNYVNFANKWWRIIRINGDGTIRMIYDGTSAHANGESSTDRQLDKVAFNENSDDNAYVGYMYGTPGSSDYEYTHENKNNSTIKTYIDNWYQTNLSSYSSYIADAIYCNDRKLIMGGEGDGIGSSPTDYRAKLLLEINPTKIPQLSCEHVNDRFTVENAVNGVSGNSALTYPIGLITADELSLGGALAGWDSASNNKYYLYTGDYYWTMTPYDFDSSYSSVYSVIDTGTFAYMRSYNNNTSARPVISLKADAIKSGTGTMSDPFRVS